MEVMRFKKDEKRASIEIVRNHWAYQVVRGFKRESTKAERGRKLNVYR